MKRRLMRAMAALTLASCLVPALAIASGAGTPDDAAADAIPLPAQIWDTFGDVYGPESGWHLETWAELGKLLQRSAAAHGADAQSDVGVPSASVSSRPDGKPPIWYSDLAPAYYWEALDEVGFNADTASALREQWAEAYGDDMRFWPLEAQALISLWQGVSAKVLPGLPGEQDMPQKEAVSLAWDRLRRFAVFEHADMAYVD